MTRLRSLGILVLVALIDVGVEFGNVTRRQGLCVVRHEFEERVEIILFAKINSSSFYCTVFVVISGITHSFIIVKNVRPGHE